MPLSGADVVRCIKNAAKTPHEKNHLLALSFAADKDILYALEEDEVVGCLRAQAHLQKEGTSSTSTPVWAARMEEDIKGSMGLLVAATIFWTLASKPGSESTTTKEHQQQFKLDLISAYLHPCSALPRQLQCMVTGLTLDSDLVIAAHLNAKSAEAEGIMTYGISTVWNHRNGMLWAEPIEHAYHGYQICFMLKKDTCEYVFVVLDKDLLSKPLSDLGRTSMARKDARLRGMTFAECDMRPLTNPRGGEPYGRILAAHGALSVLVQRGHGKLRDDMTFSAEDFQVTSEFELAPNVRSYIMGQLPAALIDVA